MLKSIEIESLVEYSIEHLNGIDEFKSEHEIYCYIRMFRKLPKKYQEQMKGQISNAIRDLVCLDIRQWDTYVPKPLDFIHSKQHPLFHEVEDYVDMHCDYLVDTLREGIWQPTWEWGQYEHHWEQSRKNWIAVLTTKNYLILREFGRLE